VLINGTSVDPKSQHVISPGDRIEMRTPGGGGFGDPHKRDPAKVARDVMRGYYTREQAEKLFGVRFRPDGSAFRPA